MKRYLPKNAEDASALILTLLVIVLLSTVVTSFLSSTRTEQTATRNYTSKTQAEQFATSATQQAMAKIQSAFNGNGTVIVVSQPGAIRQLTFTNGTCTQNATNLYTENGTEIADMNNLQNPGNATLVRANTSANQTFTITGNASERIKVYMENVTTTVNGTSQTIGRIAYYVDDESTKININAATDNRTTLNVSTPRSLALAAFTSNSTGFTVSSSQVSLFQNLINGNGSSTGNMTNWGYIFRKEQLASSLTFNATGQQLANISTAPLSDFHLKFTPWGARRLHINDEPLNSTGVDNVYAALSSTHLKNIYGQSFDGKYGQGWSWYGSNTSDTRILTAPVNGLKQIAANMLQMRSANTSNLTSGGYRFTGSVIGDNGTTSIPSSYFAQTPFAVINEFAISFGYGDYLDGGKAGIVIGCSPHIEIVAPITNPYGGNASTSIDPSYNVEVNLKKISLTLQDSTGARTSNLPYLNGSWTANFSYSAPGWSGNKSVMNGMKFAITGSGSNLNFGRVSGYWPYWPYEPALMSQNTFNTPHVPAFQGKWNFPWRVVGNVTVEMGDVKLYAVDSSGNKVLRDWIPGAVINALLGNGTTQSDVNGPNSGKIQKLTSVPAPTSFNVKQPICGSAFVELITDNATGAFISANITTPSLKADWPYTNNSTSVYERISTQYSTNATYTAALNAAIGSLSGSPAFIGFSNSTTGGPAGTKTNYAAISYPKVSSHNEFASAALSRATANYVDIASMQNVSLQRVDPRVRGYGNSSTGYSSWVVAPNTFCKYTVNGNNTDIISNSYLYGNSSSSDLMAGHNTYNGTGFGDYGLRPSETSNRDIPGDPSPEGTNEPDIYIANEASSIYFPQSLNVFDANGNTTFNAPHDLGKVMANVNWRRLRFMPRHTNETAKNLIPDWAMLDAISFSSNNSASSNIKIAPINPNGSFACDPSLNTAPKSRNNLPALINALSANKSSTTFQLGSAMANGTSTSGSLTFGKDNLPSNPYISGNLSSSADTYFRGAFSNSTVTTLANNIANCTWTSGNATTPATWGNWRTANARNWPTTGLILPGEVTEISGVADYGARSQYDYSTTPGSRSIKENEGRLSAFFPGLTTCSNFFTIYAYAQAGKEINGTFVPDSEHLTKTLVEVEITTPATATSGAVYKVKSLYTQSIPMGE